MLGGKSSRLCAPWSHIEVANGHVDIWAQAWVRCLRNWFLARFWLEVPGVGGCVPICCKRIICAVSPAAACRLLDEGAKGLASETGAACTYLKKSLEACTTGPWATYCFQLRTVSSFMVRCFKCLTWEKQRMQLEPTVSGFGSQAVPPGVRATAPGLQVEGVGVACSPVVIEGEVLVSL